MKTYSQLFPICAHEGCDEDAAKAGGYCIQHAPRVTSAPRAPRGTYSRNGKPVLR